MKSKEVLNYLFKDEFLGERFFVELDYLNVQEAYKTAYKYFKKPKLIDIVDEDTAEMMGYDTY